MILKHVNICCSTGNIKHMSSAEIITHKKKSLLDPGCTEGMGCLPQALILGKLWADKNERQIRFLMKNKSKLAAEGLKLAKKVNVNIDVNSGCNIADIMKFQKNLKGYRIHVFNDKTDCENQIFSWHEGDKHINLFYFDDLKHFSAIKKLPAFFSKSAQCARCLKLFKDKTKHRCADACRYCHEPNGCDPVLQMVSCNECNRQFRGIQCYQNHLAIMYGNDTVCRNIRICDICCKYIDAVKRGYVPHTCDEVRCSTCSKITEADHKCFITTYDVDPPKKYAIIFFDFEATQNTMVAGKEDTYLHKPNLCVANLICHECVTTPDPEFQCRNCVQRVHIFENSAEKSCVAKFIDFCEVYRSYSNTVCCIAHNFKGK